MPSLSDPLRTGNCQLKHRLVMAPLTRYRADDSHVPLPMATEYYAQRASVPGTLLITEATFISPYTSGYNNIPGINSAAQIAQWKEITAAPDLLAAEGYDPVSSSATPMSPDAPTPRALTEDDIHAFIADYASAAEIAITARIYGVEILAANGYLIGQLTQDTCNRRRAHRHPPVTLRRLPGHAHGAPEPQFVFLARELHQLRLRYLHVVDSRVSGTADVELMQTVDFLLEACGGDREPRVGGRRVYARQCEAGRRGGISRGGGGRIWAVFC
ncbi:hypothetical protein MMC17_005797 [Xylographa soralifera]|nr:hypothetical protein [Xylographa soralifera]